MQYCMVNSYKQRKQRKGLERVRGKRKTWREHYFLQGERDENVFIEEEKKMKSHVE